MRRYDRLITPTRIRHHVARIGARLEPAFLRETPIGRELAQVSGALAGFCSDVVRDGEYLFARSELRASRQRQKLVTKLAELRHQRVAVDF